MFIKNVPITSMGIHRQFWGCGGFRVKVKGASLDFVHTGFFPLKHFNLLINKSEKRHIINTVCMLTQRSTLYRPT